MAHRRSGYLLLEVVIALGLLLMGLATIGMQVQSSWDTSVEMHQVMRAMNLAESKLAELDAQLIVDVESAVENDLEEEFGRLFPDYAWRLRIEPTVTDDLWQVSLKILYNRRLDIEEEFDFDTAKVIYDVNTLRATPATIDPQRDFGADEESMQQLVDALAGTELDPYNLDLRQLGGLPLEDLLGLLTALEETGLLSGMDLSTMLPPDVMQMLDEILGDTGDEESPDDGGDAP